MRRVFLVAAIVLASLGVVPASASAATVGENPVDWTPHVLDGHVSSIAIVGDTAVVGGDFSAVTDSTGGKTYERWYLFAFSLTTGQVLDFAPNLDGPVRTLAAGADNSVYVGGLFQTVGKRKQNGLTRLSLSTGARLRDFDASITWGEVDSLEVAGSWLYVGGDFDRISGVDRIALARVDLVTGATDKAFNPRLAAPGIGRVKVEDLTVSPGGDRLIAIGALTESGGEFRVQVAMFDLGAAKPRLANWWTDVYNTPCRKGFDTYLRDVDFSPDGSYFVIVTTGRKSGPDLMCDTAARFETYDSGEVFPTWVNHTGGDSLYAVEVTDSAVYVGGHQRWLDNPEGNEDKGPGAVERPGIAAIHPRHGHALPWNPTRDRGVGVQAFVADPRGLLVGSDTDELGRERHAKIGMFPPA